MQGITIQLKRTDSLYNSDGSPIVINYTEIDGSKTTKAIKDIILEYGEPLLIEDQDILVVGNGKQVFDTATKKWKLVGQTVEQLINSREYFAKVKDPILYGNAEYHYLNAQGEEAQIPVADRDNTIANTEFVHDVVEDEISKLDEVRDAVSYNPGVANTLSTFYEQDGVVHTKFEPISISYQQINDATPGEITPNINGVWIDSTGKKVAKSEGYKGESVNWSREDHTHPDDDSKADIVDVVSKIEFAKNGTSSAGSLTQYKWNAEKKSYEPVSPAIFTKSEIKEALELDNVTNESKETMFTSPNFTGVPTSVTPDTSKSGKEIATMEAVHNVMNYNKWIYFQEVDPRNTTEWSKLSDDEKKLPRLWIHSGTGVIRVWNGNNWIYVYSVWGTPSV